MSDFKKLSVWQKSHHLTLEVYKATANFPKEEIYGLTSQIRRAAASIPANIAEGSGRSSDNELIRFLHISMGSAHELEYHVLLSRDLGFLSNADYGQFEQQITEIGRMLRGLIQKLKS